MTTIGREYDVLVRGDEALRKEAEQALPTSRGTGARIRLLRDWGQVRKRDRRDLFVLMSRGDFFDETEFEKARTKATSGEKRFLVLPDDTPSESLISYVVALKIRSAERIHTPRFEVDDLRSFLRRFLTSLAEWPEQRTIMDAWWEADKFVVLAPTFQRLRVPVHTIPKLGASDPDSLAQYEIDDRGEFVYWPKLEVHMGWDQFEQALNPQSRIRAEQRSKAFNERYGSAIRALREAHDIAQSQVEGLDPRTVRRIEKGQTRATAKALRKLAAAHGMDANQYMAAVARRLGDDT